MPELLELLAYTKMLCNARQLDLFDGGGSGDDVDDVAVLLLQLRYTPFHLP